MKILIAAGGTYGHLFPAVRLAEEIMSKKIADVLFIVPSRPEDTNLLRELGIPFESVPVVGFQSKTPLRILEFAIRLMAGSVKSLALILKSHPAVAIGFGGYVSGPVLLLASILNIKTIIHEQNVYPGRTNKILANFVDRIAISFPETGEYLKKYGRKIVFSGNPLRRNLKRGPIRHDTDSANFTILAMGGSQGSHKLNKLIPEAVHLLGEDRKKKLEVIHLSGDKDRDNVMKAYRNENVRNRVFSFTNEMDRFYNECDFVIGRAGAGTISELLYLAKPAILIPYPYAGSHQYLNAKVLEKAGLGIVFEEEKLSAEELRDAMVRLMDKPELAKMAKAAQQISADNACDILIREIIHER